MQIGEAVSILKDLLQGDVEVIVIDEHTGDPVEDVDIKVRPVNGPSGKTDSNGKVTFTDLQVGLALVQAKKAWPECDYVTFLIHYPKNVREHKAKSSEHGLAVIRSGSTVKLKLELIVYKKLEVVTLERRHIDIGGDDKYGHWWTVIDGTESYGWWPKYPAGHHLNRVSQPPTPPPPLGPNPSVRERIAHWFAMARYQDQQVAYAVSEHDAAQTLRGVEGELNGQTSFGGTPTMDPHHMWGDLGDDRYQPVYHEDEDPAMLKNDMRTFAGDFSANNPTWSWRFEFGTHCHSFQIDMMNHVGLSDFKEL